MLYLARIQDSWTWPAWQRTKAPEYTVLCTLSSTKAMQREFWRSSVPALQYIPAEYSTEADFDYTGATNTKMWRLAFFSQSAQLNVLKPYIDYVAYFMVQFVNYPRIFHEERLRKSSLNWIWQRIPEVLLLWGVGCCGTYRHLTQFSGYSGAGALHRITELFRLEKTFQLAESSHTLQ